MVTASRSIHKHKSLLQVQRRSNTHGTDQTENRFLNAYKPEAFLSAVSFALPVRLERFPDDVAVVTYGNLELFNI